MGRKTVLDIRELFMGRSVVFRDQSRNLFPATFFLSFLNMFWLRNQTVERQCSYGTP